MNLLRDGDPCGLCWPPQRLGEAAEVLARRSRLPARRAGAPLPPPGFAAAGAGEQGRWLEWAAARLGLEAEAVEALAPDIDALLRGAGPALLRIERDGETGFLLILDGNGKRVRLVAPDLRVYRADAAVLRAALCAPYEMPYRAEVDALLAAAAVAPQRQAAVREALLRERLQAQPVADCWILRLEPARGIVDQLAQDGLRSRLLPIVLAFALYFALELLAWRLIGQGTLHGRVEGGWLSAWLLLVVSLVPLQWLASWLDAHFALDAGRILKARLLAGALRSDLDAVSRHGAGEWLGRVIESQALESLALNGGFGVLVAVLELLFAGTVLLAGAGGTLHVALMTAWVMATLAFSARYLGCLRRWTGERLRMTHDLVERMVGHRTRLAQEQPRRRAHEEDGELAKYLRISAAMDQSVLPVVGVMPRGWMLVALAGIAPGFVAGTAGPVDVAIAIGGMLLASRALTSIASGLSSLARALVAWRQVSGFLVAGEPAEGAQHFLTAAAMAATPAPAEAASGPAGLLLDGRNLSFRYPHASQPALDRFDLAIARGERVLVQGPSGGGKSTLAALLAGLRQPMSGSLLLHGLDRPTLGEQWHRLAAQAPQFHENHIFTGTLAFNLLMGRGWPASADDLQEARSVCAELGLAPLLERMPAGVGQTVGETGWQLSHGERSRVFLARALLQNAPLTILDESFSALDAATLRQCFECVLRRALTLVVIAHP